MFVLNYAGQCGEPQLEEATNRRRIGFEPMSPRKVSPYGMT